jgi:hypothetical protein
MKIKLTIASTQQFLSMSRDLLVVCVFVCPLQIL